MMTRSQGRVVVVGSLNADLVLGVDRIPRPGETALATSVTERCGGKGANQAVAAARAGALVRMVGCVGPDPAGARLLAALAAEGVDGSGVRVADTATGLAVVTVERTGENAITVAAGANQDCTPETVRAGLAGLTGADVVVAQAEIPDDAVREAAVAARACGALFVLNLAPYRALEMQLSGPGDVLVVNQHEAQALARDLGVAAEPQALRTAVGAAGVVVTLGAEGADLATGAGVRRVPASPVQRVVDTTGAGDAFVGALAAAIASGRSLEEAVRWGGAAGALAVGSAGAQGGGASPAAIEALLAAEPGGPSPR